MDIDLEIAELVLDGISVQDHESLRAVVSAELARLISEQGLPPALAGKGNIPVIHGGPIAIKPGTTAKSLGSQIAQAVMGGLNNG